MTSPDAIVQVHRDGGVLRLTLDNPTKLNAVDATALTTMAEAVEQAAEDGTTRVTVLTGAGRAFCSGADLAPTTSRVVPGTPSTLEAANRLVTALRSAPQPVLAAVNGPAVGVGCSLVLACDLAIARTSAFFLLSFTKVGLMLDGGATWTLPRAVGRMRAARLAMLTERIPASTAADWGLVSHVTTDEDFDAEVETWVTQLAAGPPLALAHTKAGLRAADTATLIESLDEERRGQELCLSSADYREGASAFRDKRSPRFVGH
jgi:enoyl-CoA hydratase/carnithine racemase